MTLKECYQILGISQSASLEEVKRVYRRRAFELHPDLNPGIPDASSQFQKLNEAYVILSKLVSVREEREKKKTATTAGRDTKTAASAQRASSEQATSSEANSTAQEEKTAGSEQSRTSEQTRAESTSASSASSATESSSAQTGGQTTSASSKAEETTHTSTESEQRKRHAAHDSYTEQQEVLQDILSDPFARRVFEDIYSEIRKKTPTPPPPPPKSAPSLRKKAEPSRVSELLNWGQRSIHLDFSKGIGGALKSWLRNQIDEEQLFQLPAHRLVPGARIRLQIRHGFSDEITTLDVTLPPDFKPEKPIRLKGMGKKLGHWQGDLYLRFSAKTASS